jgi:glycosyltransferase involved in cell wall biosynthesis
MPLVSVIMNCYNSGRYLRAAIDSVFRQTFQDFEIIFWDNLSTDDSAAIAQSYGEPLRYFRGNTFLPLGAARNKAIARATGKYITFLDCDDFWEPDKLALQVQCLEDHPDVDFLYSNLYFFEEGKREQEKIAFQTRQAEGEVFESFLYKYPVGLLTVMVKAAALRELDELFDPGLNLLEEYDVFMRLLYKKKAAYIDSPLAHYRIHPNMTTITMKKGWPEEQALVLDKLKHLSADFEYVYHDALAACYKELEYRKAKASLLTGELRQARKHLTMCKYASRKNFCLYLATFLPKAVWFALKPLWARRTFR